MLALFAWTGYFVASRLIRNRVEALEYAAITAIVASLVAWPAAALFGQDLSWPDTESWLWILGLALVSGIGGHLLMSVSIPHLPLWASSTMTLSIPVISTVTAAIFLDESVAGPQVVGMIIVLVALGAAIRVSSATPAADRPKRRRTPPGAALARPVRVWDTGGGEPSVQGRCRWGWRRRARL